MIHTSNEPSLGQLLKDLSNESHDLLRQEIELAKSEVAEKAQTLARNTASLVVGALMIYAGFLALVAAVSLGLAEVLKTQFSIETASWLAPLITGAAVGLVGYALLHKSLAALKRQSLSPQQTIQSIRETTQWFKNQTH